MGVGIGGVQAVADNWEDLEQNSHAPWLIVVWFFLAEVE
jgi:hypothetical protein